MPVRRGLDDTPAGRDADHPDGHLLGRCEGEASFRAFLGASEDHIRHIHGLAPVAELDGDEIGFLVGKVAEIKRQR